jgi:hypothetical protein
MIPVENKGLRRMTKNDENLKILFVNKNNDEFDNKDFNR